MFGMAALRQQRSFRQSKFLEVVDPSTPTQIQRYGMPIFGYVDRSAVRRLDRHQFQPFRISGFATKRERSLPPDPGSFNQLCRPTARIRTFVMFRTGAFERN